MKNTSEVRWLLLSDINKIAPEKLEIIGKELCKRFAKTTDFVVITGNLYHEEIEYSGTLRFLNQLTAGINKKNIIMIAGEAEANYFESQDIGKAQKALVRGFKKRIRDKIPLKFTEKERIEFRNRFVKYATFFEGFYNHVLEFGTYENSVHSICDNKISLVCVSTAYVSNDAVASKQIIDEEKIGALKNQYYPCIAIMHHDYYEIAEVQQEILRRKFDELGVSVVLCGHKSGSSPHNIVLEDGTCIPLHYCVQQDDFQSEDEYSNLRVLEYIWEIGTKDVNIEMHDWNPDKSGFENIGSGRFQFREMKLSDMQGEKRIKTLHIPQRRHEQINPNLTAKQKKNRTILSLAGYTKEIAVIVASVVITMLILLFPWEKGSEPCPEYRGTTQEGTLIFENYQKFSEAWIQIVGQIIVVTKEGDLVKTYMIDGMYQKSVYVQDTKIFEIIKLECPLADSGREILGQELKKTLVEKGCSGDEMSVKEIGFVAISLPVQEAEEWKPYYYILENNTLTYLDEKEAGTRMEGIHLTEKNWEGSEEQEKILAGLREAVADKLEK